MSADGKLLRTTTDVTDSVLADAEAVYDGWFADDDQIEWDDFIDRLVGYAGGVYDFDQIDNPAIRKIQRHIRKLRNEA